MHFRFFKGMYVTLFCIINPKYSLTVFDKGKGIFCGLCIIEDIDKGIFFYNSFDLCYRLINQDNLNSIYKTDPEPSLIASFENSKAFIIKEWKGVICS